MKTVRIYGTYTHWFYTSGCWNGSRIYSNETNAGAVLHSNVGGFMWVHTMCVCVFLCGKRNQGEWVDRLYIYIALYSWRDVG